MVTDGQTDTRTDTRTDNRVDTCPYRVASNSTTRLTTFFLFVIFDWICCNRPRFYVCVSVCVSSLQPKRIVRFWWNFPQITCYIIICQWFFSPILKIQIRRRHGGHFAVFGSGTLTIEVLLRFSSNFRAWMGYSFLCLHLLFEISKIGQ